MIEISNKRLAIGVPNSLDRIYSDFFDSFICMEKPPFIYIRERGEVGQLDEMRNEIVRKAKHAGVTHLAMLDMDQIYPSNLITKLLSDIKDKMVVGALIHRRYPPFDPLIIKGSVGKYETITNWEDGELVEVDATGTGCLMFDMKIFDEIPEPWFKFAKTKKGTVGEDFYFCNRVRKAGHKIFVDTSLQVGHLALMEISRGTWELYKHLKIAQAEQIKNKVIGG